jgi:xanthine dehydrogenase accessory factor
MICGGVAAAALCPLTPRDLPAVNRAAQSVASGEKVRLVIAPDRLACEPAVAEGPAHVFCETETGAWRYDERLGAGDTVYVAGGGHVALALSRVLAALDFRVWVFDDRPDVGTVKANRYADGISIIPFEEFGSHVEDGDESYVLIMTPSHRADERVLRQLVGRPLRYLGMMASRTKAAELLEHLRREGVAEEHLQRVRTPVGIPIQSHTAEEIAISIAAELILVRNSRKPAVTAPVGRRES